MELPAASWKERMLYLIGRRKGALVEGNSMLPALKDGDAILIDPRGDLAEGDIVFANHPLQKSVKILKRVKNFTENGDLYLVGDNLKESTDSRAFGAVPLKYVIGKATCRLK
jgi:nickel-type superoxide dismutase maturation protease